MIDEETKGDKLDEIIGAALDGYDDDAPAEIETPDVEETAETEDKPSRDRDEKGRFAKKDENSGDDPDPQPDAEGDAPPDIVNESNPEEPVEPKPAPFPEGHFKGWTPELKAQFDTLPQEAQQLAVDLSKHIEGQYTARLMEAAELRKAIEPLSRVVSQAGDIWQAQGVSVDQAISAYANIDRTLNYGSLQQKQALIQQICGKFGIPFGQAEAADPFDPTQPGAEGYAAYHDQQQSLAMEQAERAKLQRQLNELQQQQYHSQIATFATATNADGSPKHPHFEIVKASMSQLLSSGRAQSLDDAYEQAAKPIMDHLAAQSSQAKATLAQQQRQNVEKAKRAQPVKSTTAATGGRDAPKRGLDDIISAALDTHGFA